MYVKLLSVTDNRVSAWKYSRKLENNVDIDMNELEKIPFSLHSLKRYVFEVEMARVMLDLIANFTKDIWSQTSRINPIPELVLDIKSEPAQLILDQLKKRANDGEPQDILRLGSPILTRIGWSFSMDHRTLMGFLKSLERFQTRLFSVYGIAILEAIGMTVEQLHESPFGELVPTDLTSDFFVTPWATYEGIRYNEGVAIEKYNFVSQLNRHADTYILSELWVMPWTQIENMRMSEHIHYHYIIGKDVYNYHILSHRACWIADWGNWAEKVAKVYSSPSKIKDLLPCKGCGEKCINKADLQARIDGKDPNLPCPIVTGDKSLIAKRVEKEGCNILTIAFDLIMHGDINI